MMLEILPGYFAHAGEKRMQGIIIFIMFVLQFLVEHILPANKNYNDLKNEWRNTWVGIANLVLLFIPAALLVELLSFIDNNNIGLLQQCSFPLWVHVLIVIFMMDFFMYWWHRFNHTQKIFWRFHRFHHEDKKMNTTTALRFHTVELLFSNFFKAILFLLLGCYFLPVLIYEILFFAAVLIHHSNVRITESFDMQYRKVFSSPWMHRIHHSNRQEETDTNYGSVFSFWDKLFGTYKKKAAGNIIFGIDEAG
jgi:sterol desaturase/sphingolipid hydroxylase (fatty acid hydroxylase superfamily)